MNYTKDNDYLIVKIPLKQKSFDCTNEYIGEVPNLVGVIAGDEFTISESIDMTYKGKEPQEGAPILHLDSREELESICKLCNLDIIEHSVCTKCNRPIYSVFSWDGGFVCDNCKKI